MKKLTRKNVVEQLIKYKETSDNELIKERIDCVCDIIEKMQSDVALRKLKGLRGLLRTVQSPSLLEDVVDYLDKVIYEHNVMYFSDSKPKDYPDRQYNQKMDRKSIYIMGSVAIIIVISAVVVGAKLIGEDTAWYKFFNVMLNLSQAIEIMTAVFTALSKKSAYKGNNLLSSDTKSLTIPDEKSGRTYSTPRVNHLNKSTIIAVIISIIGIITLACIQIMNQSKTNIDPAQQFSIEYQLDGGDAENPDTYLSTSDDFVLINPTRAGYTFDGWSGTDIVGTSLTVKISQGSSGDRKYIANWTANTNLIVFNANGGSGEMEQQYIATDATATLNENTFTRTGYSFVGWATSANGNKLFDDKSNYKMGVESSYALYAKWQAVQYSISYDLGEGIYSNAPTAYNVESGDIILGCPTRAGYTFNGWSGTGLNDISKDVIIEEGSIGNRNYTAHWATNINTITFHANGGTGEMQKQEIATDVEKNLIERTFYKNESVFVGWATTATGIVEYTDGATYVMGTDANYDLYAVWKEATPLNCFETITNGSEITITKYNGTVSEVILPEYINNKKVTGIGRYAFQYSNSLTSVTIPYCVTSIGEHAFASCGSLTINCEAKAKSTGWNDSWNSGCPVVLDCYNNDKDENGYAYDVIGGIRYSLKDNIAAVVEQPIDIKSANIPTSVTYNGEICSVTSIAGYAFSGCRMLTSITIPSSVTDIGQRVFDYCNSLASIIIENRNEKYRSAGNCILEPASKTLIAGCKASAIPTDGSVTSIGDSAFLNCDSLTSITIPTKVTNIDHYAFAGCGELTSVEFAENSNLTSIGDYAFSSCFALSSITIPYYVFSIGEEAFSSCSSLSTVTIPSNVKSIGRGAFQCCNNITSIIFAENSILTNIGAQAFWDCSNLTSINIPNSVKSIGHSAFEGCSKLIERENGVSYIDKWVVDFDNSVTSVALRSNTVGIADDAFSACDITSITIPNSVACIGEGAFSCCYMLTSMTLPFVGADNDGTGSASHFGYIFGASSHSENTSKVPSSLKTVVITGGFSIGSGAFSGCRNLANITIPNSVTSIGENAFSGCNSLTSITLPFIGAGENGTNTNYLGYMFGASSYSDNANKVPSSLKTVVITGGSSIEEFAFSGCGNLTSITIPNSVTNIGVDAFSDCSSLISITIPNSVTTIEQGAFSFCLDLTSIVFAENSKLKKIGCYAFSACRNLTSINIPQSVTSIGSDAFEVCSKLLMQKENGVSYVDKWVVGFDDSVASVTLRLNTVGIADFSFHGCDSLTSMTIPNGVIVIGNSAFRGCSNLTSITIPDSVKCIGEDAFEWCSQLIKKESGVSYVDKWVIDFDNSVTTVGLRTNTIGIADQAFFDCSSLTSITIPSSLTSIGDRAFFECYSLTDITYTGSKVQWEMISKSSDWNESGVSLTVHCSDGDIIENG